VTAALGVRRAALLGTAGVLANAVVLAVLMQRGVVYAVALAVVPPVLLLLGRVAEGDGWLILAVALALPMSWSRLTTPLPIGGSHLYPGDVVVLLGLAAWGASFLQRPDRRRRFRWPDSPVLGLPVLLFATVTLIALIRGHQAYGATLFGQPMRLFFYATIGVAIGGLDARRIHRIVTVVFYVGAVWMLLNAVYYIATGTSQTTQVDLSTGGSRVLAISASTYLAGALLLALLNLQLDTSARRRVIHATIAVVGATGVLLGFGRAVILSTAIAVILLLAIHRRLRGSAAGALPLLLPAILLAGVFAIQAAPQIEHAIVERVSSPVSTDANVIWREKANEAVMAQVRSSPLTGIGFGKTASFIMYDQTGESLPVPVRIDVGQDPHDGYLLLLSAGGVALLGSFALMLGVYALDCVRRFRGSADPVGRLLVLWAAATLFVFLVNTASGVEFENASDVLTIWALLLIPAAACRRAPRHA
jgi:O-antigen ligase